MGEREEMIKRRFKQHLVDIERKRTSVGRNLEEGLRLDRNERVTEFPKKIMKDLYKILPSYLFNAYPDINHFYDSLSRWLNVPADQLYVTNAITEGIRVVFETLVSKDDEVVIIEPTFPMYKIYGRIYQAKIREVLFREDFTLDAQSVCDAITENTSLVCLPNPNLPIESVLTIDEICKIADKCNFELETGVLHLPNFAVPSGETPESYLEKLVWDGIKAKYGTLLPPEISRSIAMGLTEFSKNLKVLTPASSSGWKVRRRRHFRYSGSRIDAAWAFPTCIWQAKAPAGPAESFPAAWMGYGPRWPLSKKAIEGVVKSLTITFCLT